MSEEKPTGFTTEPAGRRKAADHRASAPIPGSSASSKDCVRFKRPDAARLKVTPLDPNGAPLEAAGSAARITLRPDAVYYFIGG